MVPAYRSPFKPAAPGMAGSAKDRLEMIAASIAGNPRLTVDDCELRREGVSYTADTLEDIIRRYAPEGKPGLIIGDDLAAEFPQWHRSAEIPALADIIIARRVHSEKPDVPYAYTCITNDIMEISSRMVRERIGAGEAWDCLVPAAARAIIETRGLYGADPRASADGEKPADSLILRVEETARKNLDLNRFLHSRNTALLSWDLCRRFQRGQDSSLDPELGYLAGIAHDLGKPLSDKEQLRLAESDGRGITRLEKEKPSLLHGRSSAVLLKERFGIDNDAVLEAVALHTSGGENMCPLAKVVFIADKMEVSRERVDPSLRKMVYEGNDLEGIFAAVLEQIVSSLRTRKLKLSESTLRLLDRMKGGK